MILNDIQPLLDLDREILSWFNGSESLFADRWMTILTCGLTWIPLYISLFFLVIKNNETMGQILLAIGSAVACILLADVVADFIVKPLVGRLRPCNDPMYRYAVETVRGVSGSGFSFFSAHAANTFSLCVFFCLLVRNHVLSVALVVWSLVNCYTRMYLGLHYPSDILCGLLWGAIVGVGVYCVYCRIYKRIAPANNYISTQYTSTGYSLDDIDVVALVLIATFVVTATMAVAVF